MTEGMTVNPPVSLTLDSPLYTRGPFYFTAHKINPYTTLAAVPNTITGPATVNIFTAVPVTTPSACVKIGTREIFALFYWVFGFSNF